MHLELLTIRDQVITQTAKQTWYFFLILLLHTAL